ncbi:hypothetical protein L195_g063686 [Trifolium pratense]|uniref:Uncharacterized protein n=1 Tax=Trifolium pratense TaxID=57577 RepID=A0A2K3KNG1_TRIPR|nr:hypothetical protein L195_g063686 [Trifolium pratense]
MCSSSAPWRSLQQLNLPAQVLIAPCAALLRHGAEPSEVLQQMYPYPVAPWRMPQRKSFLNGSQLRHAQPCGAMA